MASATLAAEITALPEPRGPLRRLCGDLARRVRLLAPLLDDPASSSASPPLADALRAARDLMQSVQHGSKIYQATRGRDGLLLEFAAVNRQIQAALDQLPYGARSFGNTVEKEDVAKTPGMCFTGWASRSFKANEAVHITSLAMSLSS